MLNGNAINPLIALEMEYSDLPGALPGTSIQAAP
jgi:hypothetical protein